MAARAVILSDGKPGHVNQSIALARGLGLDYKIVEISFPSRWSKGSTYVLDRLGVYSSGAFRRGTLPDTNVDLVIGAGSTTYYAVKTLAKRWQAKSVAILAPRGYRSTFTLEIAPTYDRPTAALHAVKTPVNLSWMSPEDVEEAIEAFPASRSSVEAPIGVAIGGDSAASSLSPETVRGWLEQIVALFPERERWVTTSRRTSPAVESVIRKFPFDYAHFFSESVYNPTPVFWRLCDRVFVTADSASMVSEAASCGGAYLEVLRPSYRKPRNKFVALVDALVAIDAAHWFEGDVGSARSKVDLSAYFQNARAILGLAADHGVEAKA